MVRAGLLKKKKLPRDSIYILNDDLVIDCLSRVYTEKLNF
jgi:hypothetical protein